MANVVVEYTWYLYCSWG